MIIEPPWTDDDVRALQQRNAERVRVAIEQLGAAWVLYRRPAELVRLPDVRINGIDVVRVFRVPPERLLRSKRR